MAWLQAHPQVVVWALLALVLLAAVVLVGYWLWKRRKGEASAAKRPPTLRAAWRTFLASLEPLARGRPVALVVGPAAAGKTSVVVAGSIGAELQASAVDHPRASFYAAGDWLVQELAWEGLQDIRQDAVAQRKALLRDCAWQVALVVVVLDAGAPTNTPAALDAIGRQVRALLAALHDVRKVPVRVRVCVTHVDAAFPGFVGFVSDVWAQVNGPASSAGATGGSLRVVDEPLSAPTSAAAARQGLAPLDPFLPLGLGHGGFDSAVEFASQGGERLLVPLVSLFDALDRADGGTLPVLEGVCLAALPPSGASALLGDPFAVHRDIVADLGRARTRESARRLLASGLVAAAAFLALQLPWSLSSQRRAVAQDQVRAFEATAASPSRTQASLDARAVDAGRALRAPTLLEDRASMRAGRARYVELVRENYLTPAVGSQDPARRALALALLYARPRGASHRAVEEQLGAWSLRSGVPREVLRDYLAFATSAATGRPEVASLDEAERRWRAFDEALTRVLAGSPPPTQRLQQVQRLAVDARRANAAAPPDAATRALLDAMASEGLPVETWFLAATPAQVSTARSREALLDAVIESNLEPVVSHDATVAGVVQTLAPLVEVFPETVDEIAPSGAGADAGARGAGSGDAGGAGDAGAADASDGGAGAPAEQGRIDAWRRLAATVRITRFVEGWIASTQANPSASATFVAPGSCGQAFGASVVPGRGASGRLECELDPTLVEPLVTTPRAALEGLLERAQLSSSLRERVLSLVDDRARVFADARRLRVEQYYASYELPCASAEVLANDVAQMVGPGSFLADALATVARTLAVLPPEQRGEMAAIVTIGTTTPEGRAPALEPYLALLRPLLPRMSSLRPAAVPPDATLAQRAAPIGGLALAMLGNDDASPWVQVTRWLDAQAVPTRLRRPFVAPVECAYRVGIAEAEAVLASAYQREVLPPASRVWARFPFERNAEADASPADVEALWGAHGTFWNAATLLFAPVTETTVSGLYRARSGPDGRPVSVPRGSLCALTRAQRTRASLFAADGQRADLAYDVRAEPLPVVTSGYAPTMATLRAGTNSVTGFNQASNWQTLVVPWGDGGNAGLAVRASPVGGGTEEVLTLDRGPSDWSFLRLLAAAEVPASQQGARIATWEVPGPRTATFAIGFRFRGDPWRPFAVPAGCEGTRW